MNALRKPVGVSGFLRLASVLLLAAPAAAQVMIDPTRPAVDAAAVQDGAPALQSIMISPSFKAAIINGQTVKVGDKYGTARLVRVTESEAVLRDGAEVQVLRLHPAVDKTDVKPVAKAVPRAPKAAPQPAR